MPVHAKKIIMQSANGREKKTITDKLLTVLISLITSLIAGCFAFLWNLNNSVTRLQEDSLQNKNSIDELNIKMNNIQLDIRECREKIIRIESKK